MKKAAENILFIGFSIQIVFGLIWMCFNFAQVQEFGPVQRGLYSLLLKLLSRVPQVLYLLQLLLAYAAGNILLKPICPSGLFKRTWYVLALLTFPMAMQCHLALLPYSFVSSLGLLELSYCREAMNAEKGVALPCLAKGAACWLVLAWLLPEYGWLGGVPLVLTVLIRLPEFRGSLRQLAYSIILIAAFGGILMGIDSFTRTEDEYRRSFWFSMASRMAWPTIWNDSKAWNEELRSVTDPVRWEVSSRPHNMERLLQPAIEDTFGEVQAQDYYRDIAEAAWNWHKSMIIRQMGWDALTYAVPEAVLQRQLAGEGYDSYSGRNYEIMRMKNPRLTKHYVNYSCWWFFVATAAALLLVVVRRIAREKVCFRKMGAFWAVGILFAGTVVAFYTLRGAGIADYKCTLAVSQLWMVWTFVCMKEGQSDANDRTDNQKTL